MTSLTASGLDTVSKEEKSAAVPARKLRLAGIGLACMLGNIFGKSTLINQTFSLFLVPVTTSLGWTRAEFSFTLSIIAIIVTFAYPVGGLLMDRFGARPVILIGNVLLGLSIMALATMGRSHWYDYAIFALVGITAALPSTVLLARVVSTWFRERRGLALALTSGLAFGLGGIVNPFLAQGLIAHFGWRVAYVALGALPICVVMPVMALFLRESPAGVEGKPALPGADDDPDFRAATRTSVFALLLASAAIASGAITAISTHLAVLLDGPAFHGHVATVISAYAMTGALWQLVLGRILDRVSSPKVAGLFVLVAAAGMLLLVTADTLSQAVVGGMMMGIGSGTEFGLLPYSVSRYFGLRHYGTIYGTMFGVVSLLIGFGAFTMDVAYQFTGNYALPVHGCIGLLCLCAVCLFALPRFARQVRV
jgi:MFS family permease